MVERGAVRKLSYTTCVQVRAIILMKYNIVYYGTYAYVILKVCISNAMCDL